MKRLIVMAVLGLVVGLGGSTGVAVALGRHAPHPRADSTAATAAAKRAANDSGSHAATAADSVAFDSTTHDATSPVATKPVAAHSAAPPAADSEPAQRHPAALAAHHDSTPPVDLRHVMKAGIVTAALPRDTVKRVDTARVGRLARLFAAMPARDAAKVLVQMSNADAQLVISAMDNRHAADILSNFPPDRVAAMSQLTLRPPLP